MTRTILQKSRTLLRYFWPTVVDWAYVKQIKSAGKFDREFYLAANPGLKWLFRIWPIRHYVQLGENHGLCPNPQFSPRAYLFHNPDLLKMEIKPLQHFIEFGEAEGRIVLAPLGQEVPTTSELPQITVADRLSEPAQVAVLLHIYYHEFWEEMVPILAAQAFPFDLFVTVTRREGAENIVQEIQAAWPNSRVWLMPNHGRDIFPFLHLINSEVLEPYLAICKLHSKRSPHRPDGDIWRQALVSGLLGDPTATSNRLSLFLKDDKLGVWVANEQRCEGDTWWGSNRARAEELLSRVNLDLTKGQLCFPAGSIYWIKAPVLERLKSLELMAGDFEPEQALVDGTMAHVVERALGILIQADAKRIIETAELDRIASDNTDPPLTP